ncbi:MAG: hypothetical protein OXC14_12840 [Rhodospirillaceae bacterium]|nr:hypothetical protein [Rhodospirillaceae bacterium]
MALDTLAAPLSRHPAEKLERNRAARLDGLAQGHEQAGLDPRARPRPHREPFGHRERFQVRLDAEGGFAVYGFGESRTPHALRSACQRFEIVGKAANGAAAAAVSGA